MHKANEITLILSEGPAVRPQQCPRCGLEVNGIDLLRFIQPEIDETQARLLYASLVQLILKTRREFKEPE